MTRDALIATFLARHSYAEATAAPLAQDASFRRYLRLSGGPRLAVLMDAPPPEDVRPFLRIAAHLAGVGLSAPQIIAADPENGLVLEEDLGDALLSQMMWVEKESPPPLEVVGWGEGCAQPTTPAVGTTPLDPLLQGKEETFSIFTPASASTSLALVGSSASLTTLNAAVDVLVAIQRAAPPSDLPVWDAPTMAQAARGTLLDWWWPATFGFPAPPAAREDFGAALYAMLRMLAEGPRCLVHRDFFAGNLLWLPERTALRRIGILDFQGAALGHPAYDLVSLLQDARRDIPQPLADHAVARYLAARPDLDPAAFRAAYAICAAQRHLRVACQWVRLALRDHRPHYLAHGPRTWRLLNAALCHPAAAPLAAAMDRWIPPDKRANPQGLAA
jgi:aminoglycoside/choline kinase family phosphotransferase